MNKKLQRGNIVFILILLYGTCFSQDQKVDPRFEKFQNKVAASKGIDRSKLPKPAHANEFFKTYEDYLAGKPVEGIKITDGYGHGKKPSLFVNRNGNDMEIKIDE